MENSNQPSADLLCSLAEEIGPFYIVGGCVRDMLMGQLYRRYKKRPIDIDIAVESSIETIREKIQKGFFSNREEMTLTFFWKGLSIDLVSLSDIPIEKELLRRDLTVNSMGLPCPVAFSSRKNGRDSEGTIRYEDVIDPTGGWPDLYAKTLRCADENNLIDDPVRMVRVFRFQGEFGFEIEDLTFQWINRHAPTIRSVAKERVERELEKLFATPFYLKALRELKKTRLFGELFPLLTQPLDFRHQDRHHFGESIFDHSLRVISGCGSDPILRWAGLFHDAGKQSAVSHQSNTPEEKTAHYYRHEEKSVEIFQAIAKDWGLPKKIAEPVEKIIRHHMVPIGSQKAIKKLSFLFRDAEAYNRFFKFVQADKRATHPAFLESDEGKAHGEIVKAVRRMLPKIARCERLFSGDTLLSLGLRPSPAFKSLIDYFMKKAMERDFDVSKQTARKMIESALRFRERYERLYFKKTEYRRKLEYYIDGEIIGVLEENEELTVQTEVFLYRFVPEAILSEALQGKKPLLFFSLSP